MQEQTYLPSSSERKRALTTYLLVGLLFFSGKEELTVFEYYHFRQAIGWYGVMMVLLLAWLMIFWIPVLWWLMFVFVLVNLILMVVFIFQAWRGRYLSTLMENKQRKTFYADIGGRILGIFDVKKRVYGDISLDGTSEKDSITPDAL